MRNKIVKVIALLIVSAGIGFVFQNCSKEQTPKDDNKVTSNTPTFPGGTAETGDENAAFAISKSMSGDKSAFNLAVNIQFQQSHIGQVGSLFIAAQAADGTLFFLNAAANQFVQYTSGTPASVGSAAIPATINAAILDKVDVSAFEGVKIYVGYGLGTDATQAWQELNTSARYLLIYTL